MTKEGKRNWKCQKKERRSDLIGNTQKIKMSIIYFLLGILITCPPLLQLSDDQHTPTTSLHLTGDSQTRNVVPFNALQQCMPPYPGNDDAYVLEFRLPRDSRHCDDGILICYPSTLSSSHVLVMSGQVWIPITEVQGNATLLENAVYHQPKKQQPNYIIVPLGNKILNYGDIIVLTGNLKNGTKEFFVHLNNNFAQCSKIWDSLATLIFKLMKTPNTIITSDNGFYTRQYNSAPWSLICPYYTSKNKNASELPLPPWAIAHIITETDHFENTDILVTNSSTGHLLMFENGEAKKVPVNPIHYTQIVKNNKTFTVLVNMTVQENFDEDSEVRINFFNKALEFHELYGTTVMRLKLTLKNRTMSFNSFNKEWKVNVQDNNYTFTMFEKSTDEKDNNTHTTTGLTATDPIELIPINLSFQIHVTKNGFRVKLNNKPMDVNKRMLNYPAKEPVHDIQYITVEHNNITLADGTDVTVICMPQANCVNKR
uniref:Galectin n=1 Tax=Globodera rostochiensis TaxID=31243 RepID=A0A914H3E4_GLORO